MEIYRCYNASLRDFLMRNNLKYLLTARDIKTDAQMWVFEKTNYCMKLIECWEVNSPNK